MTRLSELDCKVDFFVISESKFTFSGLKRDIDIDFREELRQKYGSKIRWISWEEEEMLDFSYTPWQRESSQRNSLKLGLYDLGLGDLVLLSDVDEIPNYEFLLNAENLKLGSFLVATMENYRYCPHFKSSEEWYGTVAFRFDGSDFEMQSLRLKAVKHWLKDERVKFFTFGGVHCTTFLNARDFQQKLRSFSHSELNVFPINTRFFLYLLLKLGITLDGKEVLQATTPPKLLKSIVVCHRNYFFENHRTWIAGFVRHFIKYVFDTRVHSLRGPE